jgi:hypothetical protein
MSTGDDEARLRAALAEAHGRDAEVTPPFASVRDAAHRSRDRRPSRWPVLAVGLAAALGFVVWGVQRARLPPAPLPTGTRWIAPTDFLLDTPDLVTLRTVPALDAPGDRFLNSPTDRRDPR